MDLGEQMRRIALVVTSAFTALVATALPALAGSELPPPNDPDVFGDVITPPGGTAFTGSDLMPWLLAAALLLAVGFALVVASRRHLAAANR
jgi:hypothetical protein